jgi:predicted SAM-dependent methyltransferase
LLDQRVKDLCLEVIGKLTLPNYLYRRYVAPVPFNGRGLHLHLGCGKSHLPGFVNIDANPLHKTELWLDVRNGLPFPAGSVDSIYSTHMLEHFYADELDRLVRECVRALKTGGGMRIVVPNLASAVVAYAEGNAAWFSSEFPRLYSSLGGKFANFIFCGGQHKTAFDLEYFRELLTTAGFSEVVELAEGLSRLYGTHVPAYQPEDDRRLPHSLYLEAFK